MRSETEATGERRGGGRVGPAAGRVPPPERLGSDPERPVGVEWIRARLRESWSSRTSSLWSPSSPSRGQCGVTALVLNDHLGGEILKTPVGEAWHFYNRVEGRVLDLTSDQFAEPIAYLDLPSTRREAFADAGPGQYRELALRFAAAVARAEE